MAVARVALRKNLARAIRQGQPWLYRDALRPVAALPDGAVVAWSAAHGRAPARGFGASTSAVAARPLPGGAAGEEDDAGDAGSAVALRGAMPAGEIAGRENDLLFGVDLAHGQKGGLFLDQRDNRALVRTLAADRRVLNLFGYTGGFSVYAAAGGARETTTVDIGRDAIAAARRNFERNGLDPGAGHFNVQDPFPFLQAAALPRLPSAPVISH